MPNSFSVIRLNRWLGKWPFQRLDLQAYLSKLNFRLDGLVLNGGCGEENYGLDDDAVTLDIIRMSLLMFMSVLLQTNL